LRALRVLLDPAAKVLPARVDAVVERPREPRAAGLAARELLQLASRVVAPAPVDQRERRDDRPLLARAEAGEQAREAEERSRAVVALARDEPGGGVAGEHGEQPEETERRGRGEARVRRRPADADPEH